MKIKEFIKKYNNKSVDVDWLYGSQCVDLIKQYTIDVFWITLWTFGGSAKTGWYNQSNTFPVEQWEKITNNYSDENQVPMPWDIIFWGYGAYWHVWIVTEAKKGVNSIEVFNQNTWNWNWEGYDDRSRIQNANYNQCLGWYRLKEQTPSYEDMYNNEVKKNHNLTIENMQLKEKLNKINLISKYDWIT